MLSIIISTINSAHFAAVSENIKNTIGVQYEIIAIENGHGTMGLCEIYNLGAKQANFDHVCFMHEDVDIKTDGWGIKLIKHFSADPGIGIIGVVGSNFKSSVFSGWAAHCGTQRTDFANIIQTYKFQNIPTFHYFHNPKNEHRSEVSTLDGVFLCAKKSIILEFPFDQNTFKGFHCYDIDVCLSISQKYKIMVVYDILLEHLSEGRFELQWAEATILLHEKWKNYLPLNKAGFTEKEVARMEKKSFLKLLPEFIEWNFSFRKAIQILNCSKIKKLNPAIYLWLVWLTWKRYFLNKFNEDPLTS